MFVPVICSFLRCEGWIQPMEVVVIESLVQFSVRAFFFQSSIKSPHDSGTAPRRCSALKPVLHPVCRNPGNFVCQNIQNGIRLIEQIVTTFSAQA